MLRTLCSALSLLVLACTGQAQTRVAQPAPVEETEAPPPVVPEGPAPDPAGVPVQVSCP